MNKILVSACLLGEKLRYDGTGQRLTHKVITKWQQEQRLVSICPEVAGGLPVPRAPAEIVNQQVITQQALNVTYEFTRGADVALALCQLHNIRYALLKESSPSCGSSTVYDGSFSGQKIRGAGITTQLLIANGIEVFSEKTIKQLILKISELTT